MSPFIGEYASEQSMEDSAVDVKNETILRCLVRVLFFAVGKEVNGDFIEVIQTQKKTTNNVNGHICP